VLSKSSIIHKLMKLHVIDDTAFITQPHEDINMMLHGDVANVHDSLYNQMKPSVFFVERSCIFYETRYITAISRHFSLSMQCSIISCMLEKNTPCSQESVMKDKKVHTT